MAITVDVVRDSTGVASTANALTFTATVNTGSNKLLVVCVMARDGNAISNVKWNTNEGLTKAIELLAGNGLIASLWYLINPTSATANVTITTSGQTFIGGVATSLFGVAQTTPLEDTDSLETNGTDSSFAALTTTTDGCALVDGVSTNYTGTNLGKLAETNFLQRAQFLANNGSGRDCLGGALVTKSPAGSVAMGWNLSAVPANGAHVGAAFKPDGGGGGGGPAVTHFVKMTG
jgi:hypothetical protein